MTVYLILKENIITGYSYGSIANCPALEIEDPKTIKLGIDTYENGIVVAHEAIVSNTARIMELKANLTKTDYLCLKHADGALSDEEYAPIRAQRQAWRDEINSLEA